MGSLVGVGVGVEVEVEAEEEEEEEDKVVVVVVVVVLRRYDSASAMAWSSCAANPSRREMGSVPHCAALPILLRCGMHESKAAVMKAASAFVGEETASRIRKGVVVVGGGIVDGLVVVVIVDVITG